MPVGNPQPGISPKCWGLVVKIQSMIVKFFDDFIFRLLARKKTSGVSTKFVPKSSPDQSTNYKFSSLWICKNSLPIK